MQSFKNLTHYFIFFSIPIVFILSNTGCQDPPVAVIKAPDYAIKNTNVILDGSGSDDPNGDYLAYQWLMTDQPDPNPPFDDIFSSTSEIANFTPTKEGIYTITLRVEDNDAEQSLASKSINVVESVTHAVAEPDKEFVDAGDKGKIQGDQSVDLEGNTLSYFWQFIHKPGLSTSELLSTNESSTEFEVDEPGRYEVELTVTAGSNSDIDTAVVTVNPPVIQFGSFSGEVGDEKLIRGKNFSSYIDGNIVKFNSVPAVIVSIDGDTQRDIKAIVPAGATTGFITVEVVETGEIATSPTEFIVTEIDDDFALYTPGSLDMLEGSTVNCGDIIIDRISGHNASVSLSINGLPDNMSFTFDPNPVPGDQELSALTLTADYAAIPGEYTPAIVGNDGTIEHDYYFYLTIRDQYKISTDPDIITIAQGESDEVDVDIDYGYSEVYIEMLFTVEGGIIGTGANAVEPGFNINPLPWGTFSNKLTLAVGEAVGTGTYAITIKAATANLEKSTVLQLTVVEPDK